MGGLTWLALDVRILDEDRRLAGPIAGARSRPAAPSSRDHVGDEHHGGHVYDSHPCRQYHREEVVASAAVPVLTPTRLLVIALLLPCCRQDSKPATPAPIVETVWEGSGSTGRELAVGGASYYWVDTATLPNVLYIRRPDSPPTALWVVERGNGVVRSLAANDHGAFVTHVVPVAAGSAVQIDFVPAEGSQPFLFAQTWNDTPVATWGQDVVFADSDRVLVTKVGEPARIVAKTDTPPVALAIRGARVLWIEHGAGEGKGELRMAPVQGGPVTTLAKGIVSGRRRPMVVADDTTAYFLSGARMSHEAKPEATADQGMTGFAEIRAVDLADGGARSVYRSEWPIEWLAIHGDRLYAWELDPSNEVEGQLRSVATRGPADARTEVTSLPTKRGAAPPFALEEKWISWRTARGLFRIPRR